jgi:hypothetical protein
VSDGNGFAKCRLLRRGIAFEARHNGVLFCEQAKALQHTCSGLDHEEMDRPLRKWLARLPRPLDRRERAAGYRDAASIEQAGFALEHVPGHRAHLLLQAIREKLGNGRPGQVQLIFERRVSRRTPGRFRTRVITEGVTPSLHVDYKRSRIKQYHKESLTLRTEAKINDTRDFGIGRLLRNRPDPRHIGIAANRRLARARADQPRLRPGGGRIPASAAPTSDRASACRSTALRRRLRALSPQCVGDVRRARLHQQGAAPGVRRCARAASRGHHPGAHELRTSAPAAAWPHRALAQDAPLSPHR